MATYVSLVQWTDQGIRNYRDTVERSEAADNLMQKMGGRMVDIFWTIGSYDLVVVMEAPDDETATAMMLAISSGGNVRTTSMRAFRREEMGRIIQKAA